MTTRLNIKAILGAGLLCAAASSQAVQVTPQPLPGTVVLAAGRTLSFDDRAAGATRSIDPTARFSDEVSITADTATPVPEPQTYAMLLAGIVVVAVVVQWRRP